MQLARSCQDYVRAPLDRYLVGCTWISFCTRQGIAGVVLWGRADADDAAQLLAAIPLADGVLAEPRPRFVDARRIEATDSGPFQALFDHVVRHGKLLERAVVRAAAVYDSVLSRALAVGFKELTPTSYPLELFTTPAAALEWLGANNPSELADELEAIQSGVIRSTPLIRALHGYLETRRGESGLAGAASALGLSTRSLQRRLREHGTSFQIELDALRVEIAQRLMLRTEASLTEISLAVGCASPGHFGVLFRKATGMSPRRWRVEQLARRRKSTD